MRISTLLLTGLLAGSTITARAQAPAAKPIAVVQRTTIYFDSFGAVLPSEAGADHREEITFRDSVSGTVRVYYPSGKIRRIVPYAYLKGGIRHGVETTWYEAGQMQTRVEYVAGQRQGEFLAYYPTGTLKRRETYAAGQRTAGELFGPDSQPQPFAEESTMPVYPGKEAGLKRDLSAAMRYPAAAKQAKLQGKVLVVFTVDTTGAVKDAHVIKSVAPLLDEAALAAVAKLKRFEPGRQDGVPVAVSFTVPLDFALSAAAQSPYAPATPDVNRGGQPFGRPNYERPGSMNDRRPAAGAVRQ
ncbi:energy transducer TonB [Hymenobacter aquaticus]|nr:energy transducer TonB [Hymenobacter aquaticus]